MTTLPQTAPVRMPRPVVPTQLAMHSAPQHGMSLASRDGGSGNASGALTAHDMWRIIRGNIWLILITVLVAGVAGYGVNSYLARYHSQYTAKGYVLVRGQGELPRPGIEIREPQPSEIELLQNTQTAMLTHDGLFMEAIQNPESRIRRTKWFQKFGQQNLDLAKEDLAKKFRVTPRPGSKLIQVEMTFSDPEDTKVIVEDMVFEHIKNVKDAQVKQDQEKVKLLGRELAMVKIELDTEVSPHILSKEKDLGADEVATFTIYNGKQIQLDRLGQERSRIAGELSGVEARLTTLVRDLEEGRTPAEVEREINQTYRYVGARSEVDRVDIELEQMARKFGPAHDKVIAMKQLRATLQAKVDEIKEELKSNYAETMKNALKNDEMAIRANAQRVDRLMEDVSKQLSELNQKMSEYKTLKDREKELRERIRDLNEEMTKINQFHINAPWASAEWGSRPQKPDRPSFPKLPYTMGVALALGLALSLGIAFLREMTDTSVRSPRDIARVGQMNLLGMIPHDADDPQSAGARLPLVIFDAPQSIEAEAFRQVRTRLQHSASLDTVRSILVTSPSTGDGKTTVACNLAAGLAQNGRRILLVDANFRKPQLHTVFGVANDMGLSDALQDPEGLGAFVRETEVPNLSVMTSGPKPANGTELLESQLQTDFIDRALEEFDHVIFDSGPLLMVADSIALAPRVDGVVTVVRARGNSRGLLMRMRDELKQLKAEHLGVILNAVRAQGGGYYGRNIQAYYRYQNEE